MTMESIRLAPISSSLTTLELVAGFLCLITPLVLFYYHSRTKAPEDVKIPWAPNGAPLLGHAMKYKKGPPKFLVETQAAVGPLFRINLAGRRMIVVGAHPELQRQISRQPESALSLCHAVAQLGFDYTLGTHNVFIGTEFHKRVLKNTFYQDWNGFCQKATKQLALSFEKEIKLIDLFAPKDDYDARDTNHVYIPDVFQLARTTILRTILAVFCGTCFVDDKNLFLLKEMMEMQDKIEDATAAAAVLPRWLANRLVFGPTRRFRLKVQAKIVQVIEAARAKKAAASQEKDKVMPYYGPWLVTMDEQKMDTNVMAELIVGLIFAAHKNPAIGAAQSYCHLWEHQDNKVIDPDGCFMKKVWSEAHEIVSRKGLTFQQLKDLAPTLRACVEETTRVTSHSLGSLRTVYKEVQIDDGEGNKYTLYPGETISSSHYLYNVDPKLFPTQVDQYRPDISLGKEGDTGNTTHLAITFSEGTHKCPGETIAIIFMQYFVALLLERRAGVIGDLPPISFERATLAQRNGTVPVRLLRQTKQKIAPSVVAKPPAHKDDR